MAVQEQARKVNLSLAEYSRFAAELQQAGLGFPLAGGAGVMLSQFEQKTGKLLVLEITTIDTADSQVSENTQTVIHVPTIQHRIFTRQAELGSAQGRETTDHVSNIEWYLLPNGDGKFCNSSVRGGWRS